MAIDQNVLIPVKLDAFVFNDQVCAGGPGKAKIAPITQPNYTFLRLETSYLQSDIMYDVDIHSATGADSNARITDLGSGKRRVHRRGVYLHWTLPRIFRSGTATTNNGDNTSQSLPKFPEVPVRWMIVRHIDDMSKVEPAAARTSLRPVTAWIVESDRCRALDGPRDAFGRIIDPINILPSNTDLQVDVSPFVDASSSSGDNSILDKQAEIFIGDKIHAADWTESEPDEADNSMVDPGMKPAPIKKARIDLRLMASSNELFPDYQLHCSNVFSIVDNFFYGQGNDGEDLFATSVRAHYSVIGWYTKSASDVVQVGEIPDDTEQGDDKPKAKFQTREQRLNELNIKIKGFQDEIEPMPKYPTEIADWFSRSTGEERTHTRSICHGAMYDVQWDLAAAPKNVAADKFAQLLSEKQPVAVGTTPMDAIMAYAGAHERIEGNETGRIEAALKRLEAILLSRDDGVEAHVQATDMMYNWNYLRLDGGDMYHAAASGDQSRGDGGKTTLPPKKKDDLLTLNRLCRLRDAAKRQLKQQQAAAFSNWWLAVTESQDDSETNEKVYNIKRRVDALKTAIADCQNEIDKLTDTPSGVAPDPNKVKEFEPGVHDPFKQQRDPTMLVGGIQSGWEVDYLLALLVRLDCQVVKPDGQDDDSWNSFFRDFVDVKLRPWMRVSVKSLLREFVSMQQRRNDEDDGHPKQPSMLEERGLLRPVDYRPFGDGDPHAEPLPRPALKSEIPLYHDELGRGLDGEPLWRDLWNDTQPWFPLFLEWEVEYTHIGFDDWSLTESTWWQSEGAKLHYTIDGNLDLARKYKKTLDKRSFSGRVLILPQPSFSLETKITQLLADTLPSELEEYLPKPEREYLVQHLKDLRYLSAPLGGFNGHLQTADAGNHVKPSIRDPATGLLTFMAEAQRDEAGFDKVKLPLMELQTDVTPYGNSRKPLGDKDPPSSFKPVAHGQFKLTKVNIIDKFGQVIHLLDPAPVPYKPLPTEIPRAYPCLSDWYSPEAKVTKLGNRVPNTVEDVLDEKDPKCEFAQVPPQVGQPIRLNARWVVPQETETAVPAVQTIVPEVPPPFWRAANDWDTPIWGWVVVNYANYGLQFFLPSGAFYREVRLGGPDNAITSPEWLPFKQSDDPESHGQAAQQLARLVETVATLGGYLPAFMAMINAATASTGTAPPSAYAEFKSALIGKPLALVNMGWSLELADFQTESGLIGDGKVDRTLYAQPVTRKAPGPGCEKDDDYDVKHYRFPVKLGDRQRGFDGLVGYFKTKPKADLRVGNALDLSRVYTHFSPASTLFDMEIQKLSCRSMSSPAKGRITQIDPVNYPKLAPYYIDPFDDNSGRAIDQKLYSDISNEQLCVFGAIVDPFSPIHAWSGILPVKDLSLPNWTWQGPIDQLSAFFHAGPVLVTSDVPDFDGKRELKQGQLIPKVVDKTQSNDAVVLPGGSLGQWSWLQPYMPEKDGQADVKSLEQFMPLSVDLTDEAARLERGPYTLLEGYLQMASGAVNTENLDK